MERKDINEVEITDLLISLNKIEVAHHKLWCKHVSETEYADNKKDVSEAFAVIYNSFLDLLEGNKGMKQPMRESESEAEEIKRLKERIKAQKEDIALIRRALRLLNKQIAAKKAEVQV